MEDESELEDMFGGGPGGGPSGRPAPGPPGLFFRAVVRSESADWAPDMSPDDKADEIELMSFTIGLFDEAVVELVELEELELLG